MSASKKDDLLKNLTRRDAQKPSMDLTYDAKGALLDQITERPSSDHIDSNSDKDSDMNSNSDGDINSENNDDFNVADDSNNDIDIASNNDSKHNDAETQEKDAIDALLTLKRDASSKVFKGFYLDPDVAKVLDKLARKHGKGIQSQMVNEALRKVFRDKALL